MWFSGCLHEFFLGFGAKLSQIFISKCTDMKMFVDFHYNWLDVNLKLVTCSVRSVVDDKSSAANAGWNDRDFASIEQTQYFHRDEERFQNLLNNCLPWKLSLCLWVSNLVKFPATQSKSKQNLVRYKFDGKFRSQNSNALIKPHTRKCFSYVTIVFWSDYLPNSKISV